MVKIAQRCSVFLENTELEPNQFGISIVLVRSTTAQTLKFLNSPKKEISGRLCTDECSQNLERMR